MVITVRCSCTVKVDTVLVACRCFIKSVRFGYIRTRHTVRSYAETKARSTFVHSIRSLKRAAYVHTYLYCTAANVRCSRYYIQYYHLILSYYDSMYGYVICSTMCTYWKTVANDRALLQLDSYWQAKLKTGCVELTRCRFSSARERAAHK